MVRLGIALAFVLALSGTAGVARAQVIVTGLGAASAVVELSEEDRHDYEGILVKRGQATVFYVQAVVLAAPAVVLLVFGGVNDGSDGGGGTLFYALGGTLAGLALIQLAIAIGNDVSATSTRDRWLENVGLAVAPLEGGALLAIGGRL